MTFPLFYMTSFDITNRTGFVWIACSYVIGKVVYLFWLQQCLALHHTPFVITKIYVMVISRCLSEENKTNIDVRCFEKIDFKKEYLFLKKKLN